MRCRSIKGGARFFRQPLHAGGPFWTVRRWIYLGSRHTKATCHPKNFLDAANQMAFIQKVQKLQPIRMRYPKATFRAPVRDPGGRVKK
jgi:hypothetical protein